MAPSPSLLNLPIMLLKSVPLLLSLVFLCFTETACTKKKTAAEINAEQEKTRKEAKKQLAAKSYQDLISLFPDSEYAAQAKARLQALGPVATPAGAKATPKK